MGSRQAEDWQFVDETVSRRKFDREVAEYREHEATYRRRGWLLVRAEYPEVIVALAATRLRPAPIVTGVLIDYTNYDAEPPSFRMVDPFTSEPYKASELPTVLRRMGGAGQQIALPGGQGMIQIGNEQQLMVAHHPDDVPFLCLAGVREYHAHPAHSGDRWELHRPHGAGRIVNLLQTVDAYGLQPITDFQIQQRMEVVGFLQGPPPA
jgi:hypothetical protein